ncbi:hypothetical protein TTHERM_001381990 (macronuclear) [Tetrahymena thermophila SB210]|uniref:Uncharacterized protein n=1 Tax=Tetrahymena thermophila (strain SB210) TaxID=312017 RepID=W7XFB7_TETTS|nr:hypothetical protein TTHERM_001381990 [Tetrahymena thermophila SB210]EWS71469.1 hypothetical protein TTHERM_001381990 [Tetrahymena thermophila SB210]|eukprot:XP_012655994.1 hypothetical protein TTHERM_001381990 [Tetrahymena thermophila SB210]
MRKQMLNYLTFIFKIDSNQNFRMPFDIKTKSKYKIASKIQQRFHSKYIRKLNELLKNRWQLQVEDKQDRWKISLILNIQRVILQKNNFDSERILQKCMMKQIVIFLKITIQCRIIVNFNMKTASKIYERN